MSAKIEIYTGPICSFCDMAKNLLNNIGAEFIEIELSKYPNKKKEMLNRTGGKRTVPQIFIDNEGIGGCDDLYALENENKLEALLN